MVGFPDTWLTSFQTFRATDIVPNLYAVAATAVVPTLLSQAQGILRQYGLFGDLVCVGSVAVAFAAFVYVSNHECSLTTMLTLFSGSLRSAHTLWTVIDGSVTASEAALLFISPGPVVLPIREAPLSEHNILT